MGGQEADASIGLFNNPDDGGSGAGIAFEANKFKANGKGSGKSRGFFTELEKSQSYTCTGSMEQTKGFKSHVTLSSQKTYVDKRWTGDLFGKICHPAKKIIGP